MVDPSLLREEDSSLSTAYTVLDEMINRGNRVAEYHKHELEQLDQNMQKLPSLQQGDANATEQIDAGDTPRTIHDPCLNHHNRMGSNTATVDTVLSEWNSEDSFNGDQFIAVANSLDFTELDWLVSGDIERPFGMGFE